MLKQLIPEPIKAVLRPLRDRWRGKSGAEMEFWRSRFRLEHGQFANAHFQRIMLAMAQEPDDGFLRGKIVADFGCGPRGSLTWAGAASLRIGIDVLADQYLDEFSENLLAHNMIYLKSTEKAIPLPAGLVDVMFTINALDHVDSFPEICREISRVIKPGGDLIGSFNLEEPATTCEPQRLSEKMIQEHLLKRFQTLSYRVARPGPRDNQYLHLLEGDYSYQPGQRGVLWVRARKNPPAR